MKTIGVLGAGVSGLTVARRLKEKGYKVVVYEADSRPGGLAKSRITDGYVYDPHGGHILNTRNPEIVKWIFSLLPKENWEYIRNNAKILFGEKRVTYPLEQALYELDTEDAVECLYDLLMSGKGSKPENYRDWLVWNFGKGIAELYLLPYNQKIWAYPLEEMETAWMEGKMPLPSKKDIIRTMLVKDASVRNMPFNAFYYPTHGGIQAMTDKMAEGLDIRYSQPVSTLKRKSEKWIVNDTDAFDEIISTIPLPEMPEIIEMPASIQEAIGNLKFNSLTTVLCKCPKTDISWLYVPEKQYRMHRIGYQSALSPAATPDGGGSGAIEIIGSYFDVDKDIIFRQGMVPKTLELSEVIDWQFSKYAYVIYDRNYRKNTGKIFEYFATIDGFHLLGRWANWNYNNMDMCMKDAFALADMF